MHLPVSSHPPAPSHQQPSPASNSNSPSTPEGCGTQDLPTDQSSSYRDPSPSPFSTDGTLQDCFGQPIPQPASFPTLPPARTSLTVTSTVVSSPPLSSGTNKKVKKKSKKHKDKDREKDKVKQTERANTSSPSPVELREESRKAKKRPAAEMNRDEIQTNPDQEGVFHSLVYLHNYIFKNTVFRFNATNLLKQYP